MSVELMGAVFYLALPPGPKLLLLSLADNANESGHAWPSQQTLALKVSATVRSVRSQTRMLEADDWLSLTESSGRGHNIHYYLNVERIKAEATKQKAEVGAAKAEKAEVGAERRKLATGKAEVGNTLTVIEPPLEPPYVCAHAVLLELRAIPTWVKVSKQKEAELLAFLSENAIEQDVALSAATALVGKWDGRKYKDPVATFKSWALREKRSRRTRKEADRGRSTEHPAPRTGKDFDFGGLRDTGIEPE